MLSSRMVAAVSCSTYAALEHELIAMPRLYDPLNREEASLFFRLVSYRYGRGAMMITTNKSIRDWTGLLVGDEVLATAILDRLLHRAHVLNIKGRSYRLRDLEDALKA
jgi:DNA replication protein DnaC